MFLHPRRCLMSGGPTAQTVNGDITVRAPGLPSSAVPLRGCDPVGSILCHNLIRVYSTIRCCEGNNNIRSIIIIMIRCQIGLMWCIKHRICKLHPRVQTIAESNQNS